METKSDARNGEIDVLRFIFSITVVFHHFNTDFNAVSNDNGSIAVEFFFLVTGFLMAKHVWISNSSEEQVSLSVVADDTWIFIINKVRSFYKYYIIALFLNVIVLNIIIMHQGISEIICKFIGSIPVVSLLFMGLDAKYKPLYFQASWFLSAMIIAILILFPMLRRNYNYSVKIVFPIIALFICGYNYATKNTVAVSYSQWGGVTYYGVLRAISEIAIGASLFALSEFIKKQEIIIDAKAPRKVALTLFRVLCYCVVYIYIKGSILGEMLDIEYSLHALLFCAVGVVLSFSNVGYCIKDSRFTRYLAKLSLPIYMFHGFIEDSLYGIIGHDLSIKKMLTLILFTVFASVVLMYVTDIVYEKMRNLLKIGVRLH